jgi:hypothetical protein
VVNKTYDDRCSAKDDRARTGEAVGLVGITYTRNIGENPGLYAKLCRTRDYSRNELCPEHVSLRYLHVVTELEVRDELQRLGHRDVTVGGERMEYDEQDGLKLTPMS